MKTIPLTQGKFVIVDDADYEKVRGLKWHASKMGKGFYVCRNVCIGGKQAKIRLHRVITNCPPGLEVNHINGDGLDNRRENLQTCTPQQQQFAFRRKKKGASSEYRGVSWHKPGKRWCANIRYNDKLIYLGLFDVEADAARTYDAKAIELFGEFACPNFPLTADQI